MRTAFLTFTVSLALSLETVADVTFSGSVRSAGGAVAGAEVRATIYDRFTPNDRTDFVGATDAEGKFSIQLPQPSSGTIGGRPESALQVRVTASQQSGLLPEMIDTDLSGNVEARFVLHRPVRLSGRVSPAAFVVELFSLTTNRSYQVNANSGTFDVQVVPDLYAVQAFIRGADFSYGRTLVDGRAGDVTNIDLRLSTGDDAFQRALWSPPNAARITVSAPNDDGIATIAGAAGATHPSSAVLVANLETLQINLTASKDDGSFSAPMFAPYGANILVKHDPTGRFLPRLNFGGTINEVAIPTGTMLYVAPPPSATGVAVATGSRVTGTPGIVARDWRAFQIFGTTDPGQWSVRGTIEKLQWNPGDRFQIRGTLTIHSRQLASVTDPGQVTINTPIKLDRLFDAAGRELGGTPQFLSSMMTPTQFPIERSGCCRFPGSQTTLTNRRIVEGRRFEADWTSEVTLPANLPAGMYRLSVSLNTSLLAPETIHFDVYPMIEGGFDGFRVQLPIITVGQPAPPRLTWILGLNTFSNGSRGAIAQEDRGKLQVASHVMINNDRLVVPRVDARSGKPLRYRLEPFVPTIGASNARITAAPRIAFKFPSGTLSVRVHRPDGIVDDLGSAPFVQSRSETPVSRTGIAISAASASVSDFFELTTLDPRFEYAFSRDGLHRVVMTGVIADQWGNQYAGGGTYEVYVGRTLDLDFGVLPGTPFEEKGSGSPVIVVHPPLPAEIEMRVTHAPLGDATKATVRTIVGRANRFGHYSPGEEALRFDRAGEYRIDVTARWTAANGQEWVGLAAWGNVIATPDSPLITHGRRGFDGVGKIQDQWLLVRERRAGGDHLMFPFHHGDVVWMQKDDPAAGIPKITVQDPQGAFAQRVRNRSRYSYSFEPPSLEERIAAGEIPLATTTTAGGSPSATPEGIDQWGYFYAFVERPGVRVREFVSEDVSSNGYWRFADNYHFQLGNGLTGDLPNDFKFQFGGAVYRESLDSYSYFGSYASFFVILPLNDSVGGRLFPPFQGNGGGPSGGPLFRLKDRDIDLFFHPTGVRPGTILVQGDTASFAGYSAPTLPSKISIDVTSPSGRVRTIKGQANKVGYFYDSGYDFAVDEPGVWKAKVKIVFDGATSAGQVTAPFPTGGVLGSREGEFYFYVVRGGAAPLTLPAMPQFVRPAEGPLTFNVTPPAGLTNLQLTYTTTMPGFILEEGTTGALAYTYDAPRLAHDFPNLDQFDQDGFAGADTITISLLLSGTDAAGKRQHFARQIVIQGEEVQMTEQGAVAAPPRRRAARR